MQNSRPRIETTEPTNKSYILATTRTCWFTPHKRGVSPPPPASPSITKCAEGVSSSQEENSPIIASMADERGGV